MKTARTVQRRSVLKHYPWARFIQHKVVEESKVWRFRRNRIICDLLTAASEGRQLDLNEIGEREQRGVYTLDERKELYRLIGYSLAGYAECFVERWS